MVQIPLGDGSYGNTIFGREVIESGAVKVTGSEKEISNLALLLTEAARSSLAAMSYMGKMKMESQDFSKNPNRVLGTLVRNDPAVGVDDWVSGKIDLADIEGKSLQDRVLSIMHVVAERWDQRNWLYMTRNAKSMRFGEAHTLKNELEPHYQAGHAAAIDFNNGIRRSRGLPLRPHFNIFKYWLGIDQ